MTLTLLMLAMTAWAEVPSKDARWDAVEATRYSFPMPNARTKPEWEQRRAHLK